MIYYLESERERDREAGQKKSTNYNLNSLVLSLGLFNDVPQIAFIRYYSIFFSTAPAKKVPPPPVMQPAGPQCAHARMRTHTIKHTKDCKTKFICMTWFIWGAIFCRRLRLLLLLIIFHMRSWLVGFLIERTMNGLHVFWWCFNRR